MIPVDGAYLYKFGKSIKTLYEIKECTTYIDAFVIVLGAKELLDSFLNNSVYSSSIKIISEPAKELVFALDDIRDKALQKKYRDQALGEYVASNFINAVHSFETVLNAEFQHSSLFLATPKGAYDTATLIFRGELLLPNPIFSELFPSALPDVKSGARCLAFELYTASGFHFHRANESVVLKYLEILSGGTAKPQRNMGKYISALRQEGAPETIISCLTDLKNMHRNPLMHPDETINDVDDAIALLNSIHTAITGMIREIRKINHTK